MTIAYEWRGEFASAEANRLPAECFDHAVLADQEWDWRDQVGGTAWGGCPRGTGTSWSGS